MYILEFMAVSLSLVVGLLPIIIILYITKDGEDWL